MSWNIGLINERKRRKRLGAVCICNPGESRSGCPACDFRVPAPSAPEAGVKP